MKLKLVAKKKETREVKSFIFRPEKNIRWTPGQFLVYKLPHPNEDIRGIQRFFTISSAPFEKHVAITTRIEKKPSSFKRTLSGMKKGGIINAKDPEGDFIIDLPVGKAGNPKKKFVFIAGGIGVTPFRSIVVDLSHEKLPINITLLYANKTNNFPFKKEFEDIASRNPGFKIHYFVSPKRIDEDAIREKVQNLERLIFYISGPEKMVEDFTQMLKKMGISQKNIKQDFFPGYENLKF